MNKLILVGLGLAALVFAGRSTPGNIPSPPSSIPASNPTNAPATPASIKIAQTVAAASTPGTLAENINRLWADVRTLSTERSRLGQQLNQLVARDMAAGKGYQADTLALKARWNKVRQQIIDTRLARNSLMQTRNQMGIGPAGY